MAQTRFSSDALRIQKKLEVSSFEGRYALTTPGPGINLTFREDPYIRLQKFGANIMTNTHNVENDLMERNRIIPRDIQEYKKFKPNRIGLELGIVIALKSKRYFQKDRHRKKISKNYRQKDQHKFYFYKLVLVTIIK